MALPLILAGLSLVTGIIGLGMQAAGTAAQMEGNKQAAEASRRAEALRKQQMDLESARQRRQVVRNALRARSLALTASVNQGASSGSGIQGGLSQVQNQTASNIQGINQGQQIGAGIFDANMDVSRGQELASFGSGLSSLGGALFSSAPSIGRLGNFAAGQGR